MTDIGAEVEFDPMAAFAAESRAKRNRILAITVVPFVLLIWWILTQMSLEAFFSQILNGLSFGAVLFFLASGFTLIFGLMRITNLAHGGFYLVGGYVGITTVRATGNFWLAILVSALAIMVLGLFTERILLRPIRGMAQPEVLLTIGLTFILGDLALAIWGGDPTPIPKPSWLNGALRVGDFAYPRYRLFVIACAILMGVLLFWIEKKTRWGAMVRAGVDDREMVAALGVNIKAVFTGAFMFGAFLAGFAGVIGGAFLTLLPGQDFEILLFALAVVIIGGLGSLKGAMLGVIIVGLIDSFGKALVPELSFFTLFAPMAIILMVRPQGLLGKLS